MAKKYCKICGAEWEENFDECPNCGMPADPDEQLWFDKDARRRLERKKRTARKKPIRRVSKLNRGIFLPLILGTGAVLRIIASGGFSTRTMMWDVIGVMMFVVSAGYIIKAKFFNR
ncbi:MAG: hypothetical protein J7K40_06985 [candidate division Zixibacteria bacterium]|nr:hypothetical protein [candidate division Zixibacteria bacterium]